MSGRLRWKQAVLILTLFCIINIVIVSWRIKTPTFGYQRHRDKIEKENNISSNEFDNLSNRRHLIQTENFGYLVYKDSNDVQKDSLFQSDLRKYNITINKSRYMSTTAVATSGSSKGSMRNIKEKTVDKKQDNKPVRDKCPDILAGMTKGKWITRPLTREEETSIDAYLRWERGDYNIPPTYQRDDGLCGTVPYKRSPLYKHMWFKAICDPKGKTPCCQTDRCVSLPEEKCQCPTCYDERQAIHAEFSTWKPDDINCRIKHFSSEGACNILKGATVYFVGDSFIRHVYAAMAIVLTNNTIDGALQKNASSFLRKPCFHMRQITGHSCRNILDEDQLVCNDTVKIKYIQAFPARDFAFVPDSLRSLRHVNRSIMVLGLGIHDNFNFTTVAKRFLLPLLNLRQYLSTNLTSDLDVYEVLANFGDLSNGTDFANAEDNISNSSSPAYEYLMDRNIDGLLHEIGIDFPNFVKLQKRLFEAKNRYIRYGFQWNETTSQGTSPLSFNNQANTNSGTAPPVVLKNTSVVFERLPKPGVDVNHLWPRLIWIGTHAPGLLKSPKFEAQTAEGVQNFNSAIHEVLKQWNVPYLDTFTFSDGTVSFDGTHYGWGINMLKIDMLLNYFNDILVKEKEWR